MNLVEKALYKWIIIIIIFNYILIIKLHFSRSNHKRGVESREDLEHRDAAKKRAMSTSSRANDHIHAVEQAVEMEDRSEDVSSSSPHQIQHKTNPSVNPMHDKPASPLYPSFSGEPSDVALGEMKTNDTKTSKSELGYNPVKSQQIFHVNEAFQESDVADTGHGNQDNGSNSSPNNADGPEKLEPKKAPNDSPVSNFKVQPEDEKQNVAGQSSADTYNGEHESQPKTEHSINYLPKGQSPQETTSF